MTLAGGSRRHGGRRRAWAVPGLVALGGVAIALLAASPSLALDVEGVLPTSIGLPEANVVVRPVAGAAPYAGLDSFGDPTTNLRLVYDTGASGVVVFEGPAQALSLPVAQFSGSDVLFEDVGVGGSTTFEVSDPLHLSLGNFTQDPPAPYSSDADYPRESPGLRLQLGPPGSANPFLADFTLLGIAGMPAMTGRVSLIDPKRAEVSLAELTLETTIHTYVYDPLVPPEEGPGILAPDLRVELFLQSFDRFTETTPAGAIGPTLSANPFIGPDPLAALNGVLPLPTSPPGITVTRSASQATGSFLLDTGSQISSISSAMALTLGVRYWQPGDPGYDPGSPATLVNDADGSLVPGQFTVAISGIGGVTTIAGFELDEMLVRTLEGDPMDDDDPAHLRFPGAPVFVQDIELMDPVTLDVFVFDGILGTNYLFGSGDLSALSGFPVPFRPGPFEWLVLDFASATPSLGVIVAREPLPLGLPGVVALALGAAGVAGIRARKAAVARSRAGRARGIEASARD